MKKKISLLLCILIMSLSFAGCSDKNDAATYDEETLKSSAEFILSNFSAMDDATFDMWMRYHFSTCERIDLIGATNHALDILVKKQ